MAFLFLKFNCGSFENVLEYVEKISQNLIPIRENLKAVFIKFLFVEPPMSRNEISNFLIEAYLKIITKEEENPNLFIFFSQTNKNSTDNVRIKNVLRSFFKCDNIQNIDWKEFNLIKHKSSFKKVIPQKQYENVIVGGTFDRLHEGHKLLISIAALLSSKNLFIGVTANEILREKCLSERIQTFEERAGNASAFAKLINGEVEVSLEKLFDKYGKSLLPQIDCIVVSEETKKVAEKINLLRGRKGIRLFEIVCVPVLSIREKKISSTYLRNKFIN